MSVTIRDRGYSGLMRTLGALGRGARLTVGVHEDTGQRDHGHARLIDVAVGQEFGTAPYVRSLADAEAGTIRAELRRVGAHVMRDAVRGGVVSGAWSRALRPLGAALVRATRARLRAEGIGPVTGELAAGIEARTTEGRT